MDNFKPTDSFVKMMGKNFVWGLMGVVFGIIVNVVLQSDFVNSLKNFQPEIKLLLQLTLCSAVLAFIHVHINNQFGWSWQNITPGLFFVSYFFGSQFITFSNIQQINNNFYNSLKSILSVNHSAI